MTHSEEKIRWTRNPRILYRIQPVLILVGALAACIMWDLIGLAMWDVRETITELKGPPWLDEDSESLRSSPVFWKVYPFLFLASPWVELCISLGIGFAILKWQLSWIRRNEDLILRLYISPRHKELSFLQTRGIDVRFIVPYLVPALVYVIDEWFSVTSPLYAMTAISVAAIAPQFFLYADLNRIYQTAKDDVDMQ